MKGYQLQQPVIQFKEIAMIRSGAISNRGELYQAKLFSDWMFVYSKYSQQDYYEAVDAENYLKQASVAYGIQYKEPIYLEIQNMNKIGPA